MVKTLKCTHTHFCDFWRLDPVLDSGTGAGGTGVCSGDVTGNSCCVGSSGTTVRMGVLGGVLVLNSLEVFWSPSLMLQRLTMIKCRCL